jgi:hypothetical protein
MVTTSVSTRGNRRNYISNALGVPIAVTPFNNFKISQLKRMLFNRVSEDESHEEIGE